LAGVPLVLEIREAMNAGIVLDILSRNIEQRTGEELAFEARKGSHAARAAQPGTAQQVHEHGFGLVIELVRKRNHVAFCFLKNSITGFACCRLEAFAALFDFHAMHRDGDAPGLAELLAEGGPGVGVGAQAMVDVDRGDTAAILEEMKQDDGIDAAGKRYRDCLPWRKTASARPLP